MNGELSPQSVQQGDRLIGFSRTVTGERIVAYAEASGDNNPLHLDSEYANTTQFGGVIAHGMLSMAFVCELMATNFPDAWHAGGKMKLRLKAPVFPGETVDVIGAVQSVRDDQGRKTAQCSVACVKPDGTEALSGTISIALPPPDPTYAGGRTSVRGSRDDQ
jgi:3-hydroxybutyryl-CoA dehydratase